MRDDDPTPDAPTPPTPSEPSANSPSPKAPFTAPSPKAPFTTPPPKDPSNSPSLEDPSTSPFPEDVTTPPTPEGPFTSPSPEDASVSSPPAAPDGSPQAAEARREPCSKGGTLAAQLAAALEAANGAPPLFGLRVWDGSTAGAEGAPIAVLRSPQALRRLLLRPGRLSVTRAFVAGELDVEGDLTDLLHRAAPTTLTASPQTQAQHPLTALAGGIGLLGCALSAGALGLPPPPPRAELRRTLGRTAAVRHHYDLSNALYEVILGPSMVYSCAYWPKPATGPEGLADAQREKLDLICRKLRLRPGARLLDVGCGWGALLRHAVEHYGVRAVGVTLAREQAGYARHRLAAAGLADRAEVRCLDYREVRDGPYDAIASVEVTQHLGRGELGAYGRHLHRLLAPGGRLLAHDVYVTRAGRSFRDDTFVRRYVCPGLRVRTLTEGVRCLQDAGLEVRGVEDLREHFALTFRAWLANLEAGWERAVDEIGAERARAWRLFLASGACGCEREWSGAAHILAVRPEGPRGGR
ncbi:class I SAM-dependent methyltransferase [Streptomyces sp. NPDC003077]|uniref:class I SAM-dependent methyltransferase n=1 Tax=Streptomyces sp. NPDC003077 TaxID=3154443 RepID=UPI0033A6A352